MSWCLVIEVYGRLGERELFSAMLNRDMVDIFDGEDTSNDV